MSLPPEYPGGFNFPIIRSSILSIILSLFIDAKGLESCKDDSKKNYQDEILEDFNTRITELKSLAERLQIACYLSSAKQKVAIKLLNVVVQTGPDNYNKILEKAFLSGGFQNYYSDLYDALKTPSHEG